MIFSGTPVEQVSFMVAVLMPMLLAMGALVLLGRPGGDAENIAPSTVKHVLYDCDRPVVIVIDTDPAPSTEAGGAWWDVAVPEVSSRPEVAAARETYEKHTKLQRLAD